MKRAERRHHYYRLKKKRASYFGGIKWQKKEHPEWIPRILGMRVNTCPMCSCSGCGNPRRHHNAETVQEYKSRLVYADGIEEYFGYKIKTCQYKGW